MYVSENLKGVPFKYTENISNFATIEYCNYKAVVRKRSKSYKRATAIHIQSKNEKVPGSSQRILEMNSKLHYLKRRTFLFHTSNIVIRGFFPK